MLSLCDLLKPFCQLYFLIPLGIQGFLSRMDENGDAEGNFTVLSYAPIQSKYTNYSLLPVGHFRLSEQSPIPVGFKS